MNREIITETSRPSFRDNRIVDIIAAFVTGLSLYFLESVIFPTPRLNISPTYSEIFQKIAVPVGSFVVSALLFSSVKHPLRAKLGWLPIAICGLIIMAKINDMIWVASVQSQEREPMFEAFRYMEIYLYFIPVIVLMGLAHYIGVFILAGIHKEPDKW